MSYVILAQCEIWALKKKSNLSVEIIFLQNVFPKNSVVGGSALHSEEDKLANFCSWEQFKSMLK